MDKRLGNTLYQPHQKSGLLSSSQLTVSGACMFFGMDVETDGTNAITINFYDSLTAAGTEIIPAVGVNGPAKFVSLGDANGYVVNTGLYIKITCAGTYRYQVYYEN